MSKRRAASDERDAGRRRILHRDSGWALGLEVRHLRVFVTLVDEGSVTAAAKRLGVAQSTASEALATLERALGTRVMTRRRGAQAIELTAAGQALLPFARSVLTTLEDARVAVASVARDVRGRIELIANESVSTYLLPAALAVLRSKWPNLRFAVTVGMCPSITEGLAHGQFDMGLMLQTRMCRADGDAPPADSDAEGIVLAAVPLVVFSSAQHPLVRGRSGALVPRDQLAPYTIFVSDARGHFYRLVRDFFRSEGVADPRLEPTGSVEAVKKSVLTNVLGLGVLPNYAIAEELRTGTLREVAVRPAAPSLRLEAMLYRARPPLHPAVAELLDVLNLTLGRTPASVARR